LARDAELRCQPFLGHPLAWRQPTRADRVEQGVVDALGKVRLQLETGQRSLHVT
jgi:hypothetical protein